jgi:hypothetical protein
LEITVSFLGIHKWEPDIYIGFSLALHLQWDGLPGGIVLCPRRTAIAELENKMITQKDKCRVEVLLIYFLGYRH